MSTPRVSEVSLFALPLAWLVALAVMLCAPEASAQGTCSCNSGCHMYPGQCVQRSSLGCSAGYAPFCGMRPESCPRMGWVSCNGVCNCVRIPGFDAGAPDVTMPEVSMPDVTMSEVSMPEVSMPDVTMSEVSMPEVTMPEVSMPEVSIPDASGLDATLSDVVVSDVPRSDASAPDGFILDSPRPVDSPGFDAPGIPDLGMSLPDLPLGSEVLFSRDVPGSPDGAIAPMDSPSGIDTAPGPDATAVLPDALDAGAARDVQCVCPAGVCIAGLCITERCMYNPELGFICTRAGTSCRLIGEEPYCVPPCLGVSCVQGEFCDESSGGRCVRDDCAMISCPAGTTCRRNQCGRWDAPDGAMSFEDLPGDGASGDGGLRASPGVDDGGCGCRASGRAKGHGALALGAMAVVLAARRRRRRTMGLISGIFALGAVACGSSGGATPSVDGAIDPNTVGFSGPVSLRLDKFKDDDVRNGAFDSDRDIAMESGNPYAAFLRSARTALGRDAAAVLVERITLTLASDSRGVTSFEQIFTGTAVLYFATNSVTVNVGTVLNPSGPGPVNVLITATRTDLLPINAALVDGHFKVGMRVPAAPGRPMSFDAKVSTTLYFRALAQ